VFDRPGLNLEEVSILCNGRFSLKTVLWLADQLISSFEYIHHKSLVHRDVKPQSFYLGRGKLENHVYTTNFGLAKIYRCLKGLHIPYVEYPGLNAHWGVEYSRRDDMVDLGYLLLGFCRGSKRIMEKKDAPTKVLCHGLPNEFFEYLNYCRSLRFDEEPDYHYLRENFRMLFQRESFQLDYLFDWIVYRKHTQPVFLLYNGSDILAQPKVETINQATLVNEVKGLLFYSTSTIFSLTVLQLPMLPCARANGNVGRLLAGKERILVARSCEPSRHHMELYFVSTTTSSVLLNIPFRLPLFATLQKSIIYLAVYGNAGCMTTSSF
jgi:serine/threonine protein kinase